MKIINADAFLEHELKRCKSMPYIGTCTTNNFTLEYELSKQPTLDVIPRSVYDQIKWERDIAMQQLEENGIAFGAKPKVGKWVYDHWCEFKCSECGYFSKSEPIRGKEKYCPNCGAQMDGGVD